MTSFVLFGKWSPWINIANHQDTWRKARVLCTAVAISPIRHWNSNFSGGEALITVPPPPPLWVFYSLFVFYLREFGELQGCLPPWSMALSSAATPTSCACPGRAVCPRARWRSRCAGNGTTRRAGSLLGTVEELLGSRSRPATADGTGRPHREWTSTSEDTTAR